MSKKTTVRATVAPEKKEKVSAILSELPSKNNDEKIIRPEVISHMKDSMEKNHRLGELLAE